MTNTGRRYGKMNQIEVNGHTYSSIAQAWRHISPDTLKLITVRLRLRNGWNIEDAFLRYTVPPTMRRGHKITRSKN